MFQFTEPAATIAAAAQQHSAVFEAALQAYAERYRVAIVAGLYLPSSTAGRSRNVLSLLRPDGAAPIHYDKLHHYDAFNFMESEKHDRVPLKPDYEELVVFECDGINFGLLNCYDLCFPEMSRLLIEKGADVLVVASGWVAGPLKALQWEHSRTGACYRKHLLRRGVLPASAQFCWDVVDCGSYGSRDRWRT